MSRRLLIAGSAKKNLAENMKYGRFVGQVRPWWCAGAGRLGAARLAQLVLEVDRADGVLPGAFVPHRGDDPLDVMLLTTQVVIQGLQRRVDDLQLSGGQLQVVGDLAGLDQFVGHWTLNATGPAPPGKPGRSRRPRRSAPAAADR